MSDEQQPYVPAESTMAELTVKAVVLGVVLARPLDESGVEVSGFSKYVVELAAGVAKKRGIAMGTTFVPPP